MTVSVSVREFAAEVGFEVIGKLKRMPNMRNGMNDKKGYPWYMDEAGNEYLMTPDGKRCVCIVTADGGVI